MVVCDQPVAEQSSHTPAASPWSRCFAVFMVFSNAEENLLPRIDRMPMAFPCAPLVLVDETIRIARGACRPKIPVAIPSFVTIRVGFYGSFYALPGSNIQFDIVRSRTQSLCV